MNHLSKCPHWLEDIWAKSPIGNRELGESLYEHTWEVMCRLRDIARAKSWLSEFLDKKSSLWHILFWSAFFHDWGKTAQGFQSMLKGKDSWGHRHEVLSLVFIEWIREVLTEDELLAVNATIVSHHKDEEELFLGFYPIGLDPEDDPVNDLASELREEDIRVLHRWISHLGKEWIETLGFGELGVRFPDKILSADQAVEKIRSHSITIVRKQLRTYRKFVEQIREDELPEWVLPGIILRGCLIEADHVGSAHIGKLPDLSIQADSILKSLNTDFDNLYKHQKDAMNTVGSAILVAPTGSGKTEAALLWADAQLREGRVSKLFYTLPYQASMNAMFGRLKEIFPDKVGLLHGRSLLALYHQLMDRKYIPQEAMKEAKRIQNLAKLHYFPVQVFSPYQMLKAAFQLKAYEVLLQDFAGAAFIYDEIHAYDPKRLALILEFTAFLRKKLSARFFIMTATLPLHIQKRLENAIGDYTVIQSSDFLNKEFMRHEVQLMNGELLTYGNMSRIEKCFRAGKSVLVTCNTVKRAKLAYTALSKLLPKESVLLVHSRFNGRDRIVKEQEIMDCVGLKSEKRRNLVVISTQVVEVSLNIDLDVLFTDPAPLEALVQRFGRINRGRRLPIAHVYIFKEPIDGQGIYLPPLVEKAVEVLDKYAHGRQLDESSVSLWLDEVYTDEILKDWEEKYVRTADEFRSAFIEKLVPFTSDEFLAQKFERLFDGIEVLPVSLEKEFKEYKENNFLEAIQLLVPISWAQWNNLVKKKSVLSPPRTWPPVVDVTYSTEIGLG